MDAYALALILLLVSFCFVSFSSRIAILLFLMFGWNIQTISLLTVVIVTTITNTSLKKTTF